MVMDGQEAPTVPPDIGLFQDQRMALAGATFTVDPEAVDAPAAPGWLSGEIFS